MRYVEEKEKISLLNDEGKELAYVEFPFFEEGKAEVTHTIVDPSLGGQGIAGILTEKMAEKLRRENARAELTCSYAIRWFGKHPEYDDVLIDPALEHAKASGSAPEACGIPKHRKAKET